jgi:hypothetical protein
MSRKEQDYNDNSDAAMNPSLHSAEYPFCYDTSCACHEDAELIDNLNSQVRDGLASTQDADNIYRRRII